MKFVGIFLLFITSFAQAKSVLVIGDSHTAGPFGKKLHSLLSQEFNHVVTLGHSSSAALHWVSDKEYLLSGGKFNQLFRDNTQYVDPNPVHWRVKTKVPKLWDVLEDNAYHLKWKQSVPHKLKADIVVIGLGANDARVISKADGIINPQSYLKRKNAIVDMIYSIKHSGAKCVWIMPPHGVKKSDANQKTLYSFLKEAVASECPMMSSLHYKATDCDGVHFSCSSQRPKAIKWAKEAFEFIKSNI
jgi:hypothetical protein